MPGRNQSRRIGSTARVSPFRNDKRIAAGTNHLPSQQRCDRWSAHSKTEAILSCKPVHPSDTSSLRGRELPQTSYNRNRDQEKARRYVSGLSHFGVNPFPKREQTPLITPLLLMRYRKSHPAYELQPRYPLSRCGCMKYEFKRGGGRRYTVSQNGNDRGH